MLNIQKFVFNPFSENTYIVWDDNSKTGAIIDPGCNDDNERETVDNFIRSNSLNLKFLINTHCHIDHIFGNSYIKKNYDVNFLAPEKDVPLLDMMINVAKIYAVELIPSPHPDELILDEQKFLLGNTEGKFLFTPGHSPGEVCLYFEKDKICFTGDVLFNKNIGRTDLPGGSYDTLIDSIKNKLFTLPDDVTIYPGHGEASTIGDEKKNNLFFR
ncbi:MAG: MBL fold metallo-hydrolase [Bacteroidetes bacterium]|nr:MBL fold metallo-hydrolase [Bacteroidota bacterium]